jgi:arylsulfatase A-like enzyme
VVRFAPLLLPLVAPAWLLANVDAAEFKPAPRPNLVFILADDLGYGEAGCYGQKLIQTPNIDRLAAEGMRFTQCYAGSQVCAPSRSALMTGLHTGHTPIRNNGGSHCLYAEDVTVGEVLSLLNDLKLDDNTVVFFSGDNGPQGEKWQPIADFFRGAGPLRGYKREFYEGGIRVPMIVRWPGKVKPGSRSEHICAFWDFLPTAAEIAGVHPPPALDGISFLPALLGQEQKSHEFLYWEAPYGQKRSVAVRMGDWKAIRPKPDAELELYNLIDDLGETTDLADKHSKVLARMKSIIAREHAPERHYPVERPAPAIKDYVR